MDQLKLETKLTKLIIAKVLQKSIKKKYGYDINIELNDFNATVIDGEAKISLSANARMSADDLPKLFGVEI